MKRTAARSHCQIVTVHNTIVQSKHPMTLIWCLILFMTRLISMQDHNSSQQNDNTSPSSLLARRRWMASALVLFVMVGLSAIVWGAKNFRSEAKVSVTIPNPDAELLTVIGNENGSQETDSHVGDGTNGVEATNSDTPPESTEASLAESKPKVLSTENIENPRTEDFHGVWVCTQDGITRRVENRNDGTATMDVVFSWVASFLYGSTMTMDCEWSYDGEVLKHTVKSGHPQANVDKLTNDFGKTTRYEIIRISEAEMLLLDLNDPEKLEYLWKAVVEE